MSKLYVNEIHPKTVGGTVTISDAVISNVPTTSSYFYAHRTAGNVGSTNTIVYNVADSNQGNAYSTSTGIFTAPQTGLYWFGSTFINTGSEADVEIRLNNTVSTIGKIRASSSSNHVSASWSGVVYLTANQNVRCVVTSGTALGDNNNHWTTFTGYLIR